MTFYKLFAFFCTIFLCVPICSCGKNSDAGNNVPADNNSAVGQDDTEACKMYYSYEMPKEWSEYSDGAKCKSRGAYFTALSAPETGDVFSTDIYLFYYSPENAQFPEYAKYINANSRNIFGETETQTEKYEPVKEITFEGKKAFLLERKNKSFANNHSKSSESAWKKERIYVIPAEKGFYVLHYSAEEGEYDKHIRTFEKLAKSFKGKI